MSKNNKNKEEEAKEIDDPVYGHEHPYEKILDEYPVYKPHDTAFDKEKKTFKWLKEVIPKISFIGKYKGYKDEQKMESDTPFDQFDSDCHKVGTGIATHESKEQIDEEEELIFLINVAEHVRRPRDMLMFLGEYFKKTVEETVYINTNIAQPESNKGKKKQDTFFITNDIINYLGTACKMYVENQRQELRISIALYRNPTFHDSEIQRDTLADNIRDLQVQIVKRCIQVYKMIDYFHDVREEVPLKYITSQPPPYILNALFCKMKADYLRFIYECLTGDNGLLQNFKEEEHKFNFEQMGFTSLKEKDSIRAGGEGDVDMVDSEIYYNIYQKSDHNEFGKSKDKLRAFYEQKGGVYLDTFLEHEVVFEYEKAMDQLFDNLHKPRKFEGPKRDGILEHNQAEFHPVFLSSLLNQTVFLGDVQNQIYKEKMLKNQENAQKRQANPSQQKYDDGPDEESEAQIFHKMKRNMDKLYEHVLRWNDEIDNFNYIMLMNNKDDQDTARSIQNLLERAMDSWKDPK